MQPELWSITSLSLRLQAEDKPDQLWFLLSLLLFLAISRKQFLFSSQPTVKYK